MASPCLFSLEADDLRLLCIRQQTRSRRSAKVDDVHCATSPLGLCAGLRQGRARRLAIAAAFARSALARETEASE